VLWVTLAVAVIVLGALWFALGPFTTTRTVEVTGPALAHDGYVTEEMVELGVPAGPGRYEMTIRCERSDSGVFVGTDGSTLFWNEAMPTPASPHALCAEERPVRRLAAAGFVLLAALGGVVALRRTSTRATGAEAGLPPPPSAAVGS